MASFAEAPAGDVAKGTLSCLREGVRAIDFVAERALQTRSRRYTDAFFLISRSRACRREDFQDEVRAVPRRGTGGRTQTGTFTRVFWTQTNWNG